MGTRRAAEFLVMRTVCVGAGPAGLYFAILAKLRDLDAEVTVVERNPEGVTYGWGVTFSDDVLDSLYAGDLNTATEIQRDPGSWGNKVVCLGDRPFVHLGGYGFAIERRRLLEILVNRASELGVKIQYEYQVDDVAEFADADLVLATDGANSKIRQRYMSRFGTQLDTGRNYYLWLGAAKLLNEFRYAFEWTRTGCIWLYAYPYRATEAGSGEANTTFIVECAPETWRGLEFDKLSPKRCRALLERIFARHLDGKALLMPAKDQQVVPWQNFTWITNQTWYHGNVVLAGDAAHTTHFSIGNGTKLAIDDVLELDRQLATQPDLPAALQAYQRNRLAAVGQRQRAARNSATWFEELDHHLGLHPLRFAYALSTRQDGSSATPKGLPWLLHLATQSSAGRRARGWISSSRRRQRARDQSLRPH